MSTEQYDVVLFLCRGLSDKEIGEQIGKSAATARVRINKVMSMLQFQKRGELAFWCGKLWQRIATCRIDDGVFDEDEGASDDDL